MDNLKQRGRPREFDEQEVLLAAMNHFWEHGYDNTSLDDLLKVMNIKKSSFYAAFKSKKELFKKVLLFYKEYQITFLQNVKKQEGPKKAMLVLLEKRVEEFQKIGTIRGCLLMNSGRECYGRYDDIAYQVQLEFGHLIDLFTHFIQEAQERQEIQNMQEARYIAGRYINTLNGLMITMRAGAAEDIIKDIIKSAKELLE